MNLEKIKDAVRSYPGITRKKPISAIFSRLVFDMPLNKQLPGYGDDAAVIPTNEGYLLFATDGMMPGLIANEPYAAGKAAVMVCVNDIYAMGGRPTAMVNVLGGTDEETLEEVVLGLRKGCLKYRVPMVGGHLHPDSPHPSLSIATLGSAKKLLRSHLAEDGQDIVVAVDLAGEPGCHSVMSWDASSGKTSEVILDQLEALPDIAERGLSHCCKDISNGGLLGTLSIMMENSGKGAVVDMEKIPIPRGMGIIPWCLSFQSYGFVLTSEKRNSHRILDIFKKKNITAAVVGSVTGNSRVIIRQNNKKTVLFDFHSEAITGISYNPKNKRQ